MKKTKSHSVSIGQVGLQAQERATQVREHTSSVTLTQVRPLAATTGGQASDFASEKAKEHAICACFLPASQSAADGDLTGPYYPETGCYTPRSAEYELSQKGTTVYVNGVLTSIEDHRNAAQRLAISRNVVVVGVYNASGIYDKDGITRKRIGSFGGGIIGGVVGGAQDLGQCLTDDFGNIIPNPATNRLREVIRRHSNIKIYAHSQGTLIALEALREALRDTKKDKQAHEQVRDIDLTIVGSPSEGIPAELKNVHDYIEFGDPIGMVTPGVLGGLHSSFDPRLPRGFYPSLSSSGIRHGDRMRQPMYLNHHYGYNPVEHHSVEHYIDNDKEFAGTGQTVAGYLVAKAHAIAEWGKSKASQALALGRRLALAGAHGIATGTKAVIRTGFMAGAKAVHLAQKLAQMGKRGIGNAAGRAAKTGHWLAGKGHQLAHRLHDALPSPQTGRLVSKILAGGAAVMGIAGKVLKLAGKAVSTIPVLGVVAGGLNIANFFTKMAAGTLNNPGKEDTVEGIAGKLPKSWAHWIGDHHTLVKNAAIVSNYVSLASGVLGTAAATLALTGVGAPVGAVLGGLSLGMAALSVVLNPVSVLGPAMKVWDGLKWLGGKAGQGWHALTTVGKEAFHFATTKGVAGLHALKTVGVHAWEGLRHVGAEGIHWLRGQGEKGLHRIASVGTHVWHGIKSLGAGAGQFLKSVGVAGLHQMHHASQMVWHGVKSGGKRAWDLAGHLAERVGQGATAATHWAAQKAGHAAGFVAGLLPFHLNGTKPDASGFSDGGKTGPFFPDSVLPGDPRRKWTQEQALAHGAVVFVNGVNTTLPEHIAAAQKLAQQLHRPVVGVCKVTQGFVMDAIGVVADKSNDRSKNPAIATLAGIMQSYPHVEIFAHSRGSLQTSEALRQVKAQAQGNANSIAGITVTTFGNAAYTFPTGPAYHHYVMDSDVVPALLGTNNLVSSTMSRLTGRRTAQDVTFLHSRAGGIGPHNLNQPGRADLDYISALPLFQAAESRQRSDPHHAAKLYAASALGTAGALERGIGGWAAGKVASGYNRTTHLADSTIRRGGNWAQTGIAGGFGRATNATDSALRHGATGFSQGVAHGYTTATHTTDSAVRGGASRAGGLVSRGYGLVSPLITHIPGVGKTADSAIRHGATGLSNAIAGGYNTVTNKAGSLMRGAGGLAKMGIERAYNTAAPALGNAVRTGASATVRGIAHGYNAITGAAGGLLRGGGRLLTGLGSAFMGAQDWALEQISGPTRLQRAAFEGMSGDWHPKTDAGALRRNLLRQSSGFAPSRDVREKLGGHLGFDPGGAKLHVGPTAAHAARSLNAEAFTIGSDVFFGEGRFDPSTNKGLGLIAHELTHVGQQTRSTGDSTRFYTQRGGDEMEQEAQATGERVLANVGHASGLLVDEYVCNYEGEDGPINRDDEERLNRISVQALQLAETMLRQRGHGFVAFSELTVFVDLDLANLTDSEAAQTWAEEILRHTLSKQAQRTEAFSQAAIQREVSTYDKESTNRISDPEGHYYESMSTSSETGEFKNALAQLINNGEIGFYQDRERTNFYNIKATQNQIEQALSAKYGMRAKELAADMDDKHNVYVFAKGVVEGSYHARATNDTPNRQTSRILTKFEKSEAGKVFGNSLNLDSIKVEVSGITSGEAFGAHFNIGFTPFNDVYISPSTDANHYENNVDVLMPLLIHELTHSWQHQHSKLAIFSKIGAQIKQSISGNAYEYDLSAHTDFADYNTEQQASIVEDYYRLLVGLKPQRSLKNDSLSTYKVFVDQLQTNGRAVTHSQVSAPAPAAGAPAGNNKIQKKSLDDSNKSAGQEEKQAQASEVAVANTKSPVQTQTPAIDWNFIAGNESIETVGYVPMKTIYKTEDVTDAKGKKHKKKTVEGYKVIGNSGLSIATGVDLGQKNIDSIAISDALKAKLKKAKADVVISREQMTKEDGEKLKGEAAKLVLTMPEVNELDAAIHRESESASARAYNKGATGTKFDALSGPARTVVVDLVHQYGESGVTKVAAFKSLQKGDIKAAVDDLAVQNDYPTRNQKRSAELAKALPSKPSASDVVQRSALSGMSTDGGAHEQAAQAMESRVAGGMSVLPIAGIMATHYGSPMLQKKADDQAPQQQQQPWYRRWFDNSKAAAEWVGGVVEGNFNEEATASQIIADMGVSLIPGVGEVTAVRDISADVYYMAFKGQSDSAVRWTSLVLNLIGLIPEAGALVKDLGRLAIRGGGHIAAPVLEPLLKLAGKLVNGGLAEQITQLERYVAKNWEHIVGFGKGAWESALSKVDQGVHMIPGIGMIGNAMKRLEANIARVKQLSPQKLDEAFLSVRNLINGALSAAREQVAKAEGKLVSSGEKTAGSETKAARLGEHEPVGEHQPQTAQELPKQPAPSGDKPPPSGGDGNGNGGGGKKGSASGGAKRIHPARSKVPLHDMTKFTEAEQIIKMIEEAGGEHSALLRALRGKKDGSSLVIDPKNVKGAIAEEISATALKSVYKNNMSLEQLLRTLETHTAGSPAAAALPSTVLRSVKVMVNKVEVREIDELVLVNKDGKLLVAALEETKGYSNTAKAKEQLGDVTAYLQNAKSSSSIQFVHQGKDITVAVNQANTDKMQKIARMPSNVAHKQHQEKNPIHGKGQVRIENLGANESSIDEAVVKVMGYRQVILDYFNKKL